MPDPTPDDPFADLFGKLPAPAAREIRDETPQPPDSPESPAPTDGPPMSRRAAREAAARRAAAASTTTASEEESILPVTEDQAPDPVAASRPAPVAARPPVTAPEPASAPTEQPAPARPANPTPVSAATSPSAASVPSAPAPAEPVSSLPAYARSNAAILDDEDASVERRERPRSPGLEDLFAGESTTDEIGTHPGPRDKRRRRIGGWIALAVIVAIFGGIAAGGWYVWSTYEDRIRAFMGWEEPKDYEAGLANGEALLTIVSGDTGGSISPKLYEAGVTKTPEAFYSYLIAEGLNPPFQPGVFQLQKQMTSAAALEAILEPANKLDNTAQLREGLTVAQSLTILSETLEIPLADFEAAVADPTAYGVTPDPAVVAAGGQPLEGWLFPATYTFDPGVTAQDVIRTLVARTLTSLDAAGVPEADRQRVLTVASIIQREARYEDDMAKVATVIANRMNPDNQETFGLLQMDSTAQFGYNEMHDGSASSSAEALADDNLWNTYVHAGLPVGPISNPGDVAINAAMNPAGGDWLYFVTVNLDTGETVFTTNLADHNRAVEQWISWCRDNPDSGC